MGNSRKASPVVRGGATIAACALALVALGSATSARAVTRPVSSRNDSGPGSLREAIADAAPTGDTITFNVTGTITLTSGALTIAKDLDIQGPGPNKLKISGNHASRVFLIPSGKVTVAGITITNGRADLNSPIIPSTGGGILSFADLTLSNVVVSDNAALSDHSVNPLGLPGFGVAGGIASFGTLGVTDCQFTSNLAQGGDGSSGANAGQGIGGAMGIGGTATITDSHFTGNVARGSSGSTGASAGLAFGGAIGNGGALTVTGSTFSFNQAIGGNDNLGPNGSNPGGGIGGAIYTGDAGTGTVTLDVRDSRFDHNQAIGGSGNLLGGGGFGGAIEALYGPDRISGCTLDHNQAIGGAGGSGADGGVGEGGGLNVANLSSGSNVTISNSTVEHNSALGGPGGPGGNGGEGRGGGLGSGGGGTLTVISTTVEHNQAQGGEGRAGGNGGNSLGGGLYDDASSNLSLASVTVSYNLALGGGPGGQGIGGGVYHLGTFSLDSATVIEKNHASTSNDNVAP